MAIPGWTGQRNLAVILASFDDQVSPAAWTAQEQQRFFVGLRDYIATASYGRALLSGSVIGPYSIGNSATFGGNYGPAICAALKAAKADPNADLTSFDAVCVVFNSAGGAGFAYFGQDTCFIGSPFHTGTCWVEQNTPAGTIAHENLHAIAGVGDLYGTWNAPAQWDIMDCACGTHPSAFTKLQLRWLDPADTTTFEPNKARGFAGIGIGGGRVTLRALELPPQRGSASAVIIRLDQSRIYSLELRQRLDAYDSSQPLKPGIPDEGVLISYIEENQGAARPVHVRRLLKAGERFANMTEHVLTVACESITQGSAAIGVAYQAQIFSFWPPPPKVLPQLAAFFAVEALALAQLGGYTIPSRNTYDQFVQFNSAVGQDPQTVTADLIDRFKLQFDRQWQRSSENGASFYANTSVRWAANGVNTGDRDPLDFSVLNQSSSPDWR